MKRASSFPSTLFVSLFCVIVFEFYLLSHLKIIRGIAKSLIIASAYFVEVQLKEENLKYFLCVTFGTTWNRYWYITLAKALNTSLTYFYCVSSFTIYSKENRSLIRDDQQIPFKFFNRLCLLTLHKKCKIWSFFYHA